MAYYVYILHTEKADKYYIGSSQNPVTRLSYHNTIEKGFTSRYRPWKIVFTKEFADKSLAQAAEYKIKSWKSKKRIEMLINGDISL